MGGGAVIPNKRRSHLRRGIYSSAPLVGAAIYIPLGKRITNASGFRPNTFYVITIDSLEWGALEK